LVDTNACRQPDLSPDSFQYLDDIGAAEKEAWLQRWREAREDVNDRQQHAACDQSFS